MELHNPTVVYVLLYILANICEVIVILNILVGV